MGKPVDDNTVDGSHCNVKGNKDVPPGGRRKSYVEPDVDSAPENAGIPGIAPAVEPAPVGNVLGEAFFHGNAAVHDAHIGFGSAQHHAEKIFIVGG